VLAGVGNFSPHHHVQTSSEAHPASYTVGTRSSFAGGKLAWHLHLVLRSRKHGAIPPLPQYTFMEWCSFKAQWQ